MDTYVSSISLHVARHLLILLLNKQLDCCTHWDVLHTWDSVGDIMWLVQCMVGCKTFGPKGK